MAEDPNIIQKKWFETLTKGLKALTDALGGSMGQALGEGIKDSLKIAAQAHLPNETEKLEEQLALIKSMMALEALKHKTDPNAPTMEMLLPHLMAAMNGGKNYEPPPTPPNIVPLPSEHRCPLPWIVYQLRSLLDATGDNTATFYKEKIRYILSEINGGK